MRGASPGSGASLGRGAAAGAVRAPFVAPLGYVSNVKTLALAWRLQHFSSFSCLGLLRP